ncbi:MAG: hypothetical protein ACYC64_15285 [Armatimonadota bacterium]
MSRVALLVMVGIVAICIYGCGGSGSSPQDAFVVQIQSQRVTPKTISIKSGDSVEWINSDTVSHVVESGTLDQVANPTVLSEISIRPDNTFQPSPVSANFGDTVRWRNDTGLPFTMDIVNDANAVIASFNLQNGQVVSYSNFPSAGMYIAQKRGNVFFSGVVILSGVPHPNGIFQSPVLITGGTFTRKFTGSGTLPYYVLDINNPNKSFIVGSVTVN